MMKVLGEAYETHSIENNLFDEGEYHSYEKLSKIMERSQEFENDYFMSRFKEKIEFCMENLEFMSHRYLYYFLRNFREF